MNHVSARLDRALANYHWVNLFSTAILTNLPIIGSNQDPILLSLSPSSSNIKYNSFNSSEMAS